MEKEKNELDQLANLFRKSSLPVSANLKLINLVPTLMNRYSRKYYQSSDNIFRITIDSGMSFYRLYNQNNIFLNHSVDFSNVIIEIKYNNNNCRYADIISKHFPFRMTKSSKYVSGIERLY
jgi:glutamine amidotransferase-like uncharacterized protein